MYECVAVIIITDLNIVTETAFWKFSMTILMH